MTKKTLKKKVQAKPDLGKLATPVVDSAREIWLAGRLLALFLLTT